MAKRATRHNSAPSPGSPSRSASVTCVVKLATWPGTAPRARRKSLNPHPLNHSRVNPGSSWSLKKPTFVQCRVVEVNHAHFRPSPTSSEHHHVPRGNAAVATDMPFLGPMVVRSVKKWKTASGRDARTQVNRVCVAPFPRIGARPLSVDVRLIFLHLIPHPGSRRTRQYSRTTHQTESGHNFHHQALGWQPQQAQPQRSPLP